MTKRLRQMILCFSLPRILTEEEMLCAVGREW